MSQVAKNSVFLSSGITGMKTLKEAQKHRLYLYLGGHYLINNDSYADDYSSYSSKEAHFIFGGGPAVEFLPGNGRFSLNFMIGYGADISWGDYESSYEDPYSNHGKYTDYRIGLQGGIFVFYRL